MWLEKYRGFEIEILYLADNTTYSDRGRLSDFGDHWVELTKESGRRRQNEVMVIPSSAIRLMKILSVPETPENTLLRPVLPEEDSEQLRS
jgi:hypothetical protein